MANITATIITPASNPNVALNPATGVVTVAPGTPLGAYTITYQICERINPANCDQAVVTVNVTAAPIVAVDDVPAPVNGASGNPSLINAFANDTLNGVPVVTANITATIITPASNPGVVMNTATGVVSVAPGTPAGIYTITYQICENINPANCDQALITVNVGAAPIVAINDNPAPVSSIGGATIPSVLGNDSLNGAIPTVGAGGTVTLTQVLPDPTGNLIFNPDGTITVVDGAPDGTYNLTYQICEILNPTNCSIAIATVVVNSGLGTLSGVVYEDTNSNGAFDGAEPVQGGYTVQLLQNGVVVATTTSNPDGSYLFTGIAPGNYSVAAISPGGSLTTGAGIIVIAQGENVTDVNLPIDPSGIVYDALTR